MTNKIVLRSVEEFMTGYTPAYVPLLPTLLGQGAIQYAVEAGKVKFNRAEAVGDLRGKMIGPKDTEIHQIHSKEGLKEFKKYFFGAQYIQSKLQDSRGYEDVLAQVLDEMNKQSDELLLTGEGAADASVINNGLLFSLDPNYQKNASYEVAKDGNNQHLADLYAKVSGVLQDADTIDGEKLVLFYGSNVTGKIPGMFVNTSKPLIATLEEAYEDVTFANLPSAVTPAGQNGFLVVNRSQIALHYTTLPRIEGQGVNEEKMYAWTNLLLGSTMVEVKAGKGIIRQPLTFAA